MAITCIQHPCRVLDGLYEVRVLDIIVETISGDRIGHHGWPCTSFLLAFPISHAYMGSLMLRRTTRRLAHAYGAFNASCVRRRHSAALDLNPIPGIHAGSALTLWTRQHARKRPFGWQNTHGTETRRTPRIFEAWRCGKRCLQHVASRFRMALLP